MNMAANDLHVTIVGVGPGDPEMLTIKAQKAVESADIVVGFQTVLNVVSRWVTNGELCPMSYRDQDKVLDYAQSQVKAGKTCVVCAWGDLNVSARELLERVYTRIGKVTLIPGISSIQFAAARTGIFMEESLFITLHKRADTGADLEELIHHLNDGLRNIILLPRPFDLMPSLIATDLIKAGIPATRVVRVYQRLSFSDEQCWEGTLGELGNYTEDFSDLSILVFRLPE